MKIERTPEELALYLFLHRKHVKDKQSARMFKLWYKVTGWKTIKEVN